jgi:hypothetical protein
MIADVLNRQFVLDRLEEVKDGLEMGALDPRRGGEAAPDAEGLSEDDFREALAELERAESEERAGSSGQTGFDAPASDRRADAPDLDSVAFISHNAVLSHVQSALEEYLETREPELLVDSGEPADDRRGGDEPPMVTGRRLREAGGEGPRDDRRIGEKFSITDVAWFGSLVAQGIRRLRGKHPFNDTPAPPRTIADRARVLVVGDWGTGIPRAAQVGARMRAVLEQGRAERLQQHAVHLGDVYYSGWPKEYEKRFLPHWPVHPAEAAEITSWSLNANHDMYAGGHGYFGTLLRDPRFAAHAGSSYFSISNAHWRILGLDTGYDEGKLHGSQPRWVAAQAAEARAAGQKLMLLSHYQLFSPYESAGKELREALGGVLGDGGVHSWLWGHEHREVLYGPHLGLRFSACLGNGGVPAYMTHGERDPLPAPATYENRARMRNGFESWAYFGFAVLDFDGPRIVLRLIDENGRTHHQQVVE